MEHEMFIDDLLTGNEPQVLKMEVAEGPMAAKRFVSLFNNKCMQLVGFDDFLSEHAADIAERGSYIASEHAMSRSECH